MGNWNQGISHGDQPDLIGLHAGTEADDWIWRKNQHEWKQWAWIQSHHHGRGTDTKRENWLVPWAHEREMENLVAADQNLGRNSDSRPTAEKCSKLQTCREEKWIKRHGGAALMTEINGYQDSLRSIGEIRKNEQHKMRCKNSIFHWNPQRITTQVKEVTALPPSWLLKMKTEFLAP
jgi:hypothetical protein